MARPYPPHVMKALAEADATLAAEVAKTKPRKYRNEPVTVDGIRFDSKREAERWCKLVSAERAGAIQKLRRQVSFDLHAEGGRAIGRYVADFVYQRDGVTVVEDAKGVRTQLYRRSKKHLEAEYGIEIVEV